MCLKSELVEILLSLLLVFICGDCTTVLKLLQFNQPLYRFVIHILGLRGVPVADFVKFVASSSHALARPIEWPQQERVCLAATQMSFHLTVRARRVDPLLARWWCSAANEGGEENDADERIFLASERQ